MNEKIRMAVDPHDDVKPYDGHAIGPFAVTRNRHSGRVVTMTVESVERALADQASLAASPFGKALAAEIAAILGPHYDRR